MGLSLGHVETVTHKTFYPTPLLDMNHSSSDKHHTVPPENESSDERKRRLARERQRRHRARVRAKHASDQAQKQVAKNPRGERRYLNHQPNSNRNAIAVAAAFAANHKHVQNQNHVAKQTVVDSQKEKQTTPHVFGQQLQHMDVRRRQEERKRKEQLQRRASQIRQFQPPQHQQSRQQQHQQQQQQEQQQQQQQQQHHQLARQKHQQSPHKPTQPSPNIHYETHGMLVNTSHPSNFPSPTPPFPQSHTPPSPSTAPVTSGEMTQFTFTNHPMANASAHHTPPYVADVQRRYLQDHAATITQVQARALARGNTQQVRERTRTIANPDPVQGGLTAMPPTVNPTHDTFHNAPVSVGVRAGVALSGGAFVAQGAVGVVDPALPNGAMRQRLQNRLVGQAIRGNREKRLTGKRPRQEPQPPKTAQDFVPEQTETQEERKRRLARERQRRRRKRLKGEADPKFEQMQSVNRAREANALNNSGNLALANGQALHVPAQEQTVGSAFDGSMGAPMSSGMQPIHVTVNDGDELAGGDANRQTGFSAHTFESAAMMTGGVGNGTANMNAVRINGRDVASSSHMTTADMSMRAGMMGAGSVVSGQMVNSVGVTDGLVNGGVGMRGGLAGTSMNGGGIVGGVDAVTGRMVMNSGTSAVSMGLGSASCGIASGNGLRVNPGITVGLTGMELNGNENAAGRGDTGENNVAKEDYSDETPDQRKRRLARDRQRRRRQRLKKDKLRQEALENNRRTGIGGNSGDGKNDGAEQVGGEGTNGRLLDGIESLNRGDLDRRMMGNEVSAGDGERLGGGSNGSVVLSGRDVGGMNFGEKGVSGMGLGNGYGGNNGGGGNGGEDVGLGVSNNGILHWSHGFESEDAAQFAVKSCWNALHNEIGNHGGGSRKRYIMQQIIMGLTSGVAAEGNATIKEIVMSSMRM